MLRRGDRIDVRFTKWGGGRHWEFALTSLGADEHGTWAAGALGTRLWRPGAAVDAHVPWVTLFPHDRPWAASFYDPAHEHIVTYVDMTTPAEWSGSEVSLVDLDLDVVLLKDGSFGVDDEDELEEHRVSLGYPDELVELARRSADEVLAMIGEGAEPFGGAGAAWLADAERLGTAG